MKTLEEEIYVGTRDVTLSTEGCNSFLHYDILSITPVAVLCLIGQKQGT